MDHNQPNNKPNVPPPFPPFHSHAHNAPIALQNFHIKQPPKIDYTKSNVKLTAFYKHDDINRPWSKRLKGVRQGTGFLIKTPHPKHPFLITTSQHFVLNIKTDEKDQKLVHIVFDLTHFLTGTVLSEDGFHDIAFIRLCDGQKFSSEMKAHAIPLTPFEEGLEKIVLYPLGTRVFSRSFPGDNANSMRLEGAITHYRSVKTSTSHWHALAVGVDMSLNAGHSGGAVLTSRGALVGMACAIFKPSVAILVVCFLFFASPPTPSGGNWPRRSGEVCRSSGTGFQCNAWREGCTATTGSPRKGWFFPKPLEKGLRVVSDFGDLRTDDVLLGVNGYDVYSDGFIMAEFRQWRRAEIIKVALQFEALFTFVDLQSPRVELAVKRFGAPELLRFDYKCVPVSGAGAPFICLRPQNYLGVGGHAFLPATFCKFFYDESQGRKTFAQRLALREERLTDSLQKDEKVVLSVSKMGYKFVEFEKFDGKFLSEMNGFGIRNIGDAIRAYKRPVLRKGKLYLTFVIDKIRLVFEWDKKTMERFNIYEEMPLDGCPLSIDSDAEINHSANKTCLFDDTSLY